MGLVGDEGEFARFEIMGASGGREGVRLWLLMLALRTRTKPRDKSHGHLATRTWNSQVGSQLCQPTSCHMSYGSLRLT